MCVSKTSDYIQIKMKMPNPRQEPLLSTKNPKQDLKDLDVLWTFRIEIESQNYKLGVLKTSDHIQVKIKMQNSSQEHTESSKTPNQDLKDLDVLCIFMIKIES